VRIVSLCPSITETLIDFGLASSLLGITRFCIHPAEVVKSIAKVGGTKTPDLEAIAKLAPELIFLNEEENRREDYQWLAERFNVEVSLPKTVAEVPLQLRRFGAITGSEAAAEARALELEAALEDLAKQTTQGRSFRYAYLIWQGPLMTVNADTYVADLFARAGGAGVFAEHPDRYPIINLDDLRAAAPELVFLPDEPFPFQEKHRAELQPQLPGAGLRLVSGDDCCWHGVRSIRGVRLVKEIAREAFLRPRT
jgi:ABC-type Fe3+-hydroxamate transport system substrate-binding protein